MKADYETALTSHSATATPSSAQQPMFSVTLINNTTAYLKVEIGEGTSKATYRLMPGGRTLAQIRGGMTPLACAPTDGASLAPLTLQARVTQNEPWTFVVNAAAIRMQVGGALVPLGPATLPNPGAAAKPAPARGST